MLIKYLTRSWPIPAAFDFTYFSSRIAITSNRSACFEHEHGSIIDRGISLRVAKMRKGKKAREEGEGRGRGKRMIKRRKNVVILSAIKQITAHVDEWIQVADDVIRNTPSEVRSP